MSTILIVDDEPSICWALEQALSDAGHHVLTAATAEDALDFAEDALPDVVMMDVRLPGMDGLSAMEKLHRRLARTPVIVMTAFGDLETAVRAVNSGAYEYLTKPFDLDDAVEIIRRALESSKVNETNNEPARRDEQTDGVLIGVSKPMQAVFRQIALVANHDAHVLITGESGTGKELIATAIHRHGKRSSGPFVPICVPAMSEHLIESELFGHVRGAFTGADADRQGLLDLADGGTAFFDEIGDITLSTQVKLLRVLENRTVTPVGSDQAISTNFRLVAATNRNLEQSVSEGRFREDLFYRFNVFRIEVPPLRDRREDIPVLARHFLSHIDSDEKCMLSENTIDELVSRPWFGNVRELRNAIEHAAIVKRSGKIEPDDLPAPTTARRKFGVDSQRTFKDAVELWVRERLENNDDRTSQGKLYDLFLEESEPILLRLALKATGGNRQEAARLLGMHRQTLREKQKKYAIE